MNEVEKNELGKVGANKIWKKQWPTLFEISLGKYWIRKLGIKSVHLD